MGTYLSLIHILNSWDVYASAMVTAPSGDPQYFFTSCCVPGMSYNFGRYDNAEVTGMAVSYTHLLPGPQHH